MDFHCVYLRCASGNKSSSPSVVTGELAGMCAELEGEASPASRGKMARCSKAIFRWKWGLSESELMAVGVVLAPVGGVGTEINAADFNLFCSLNPAGPAPRPRIQAGESEM